MKPTDLFNEGSYDVTLNVERRKAKRSKSFPWKVFAGTLWTLNIQIVLAPLEWSSKEAARAGEFFLLYRIGFLQPTAVRNYSLHDEPTQRDV